MDVPHLFIQNQKVNEFNERVHKSAIGEKFSIKAVDSVLGVNSPQLREKILSQMTREKQSKLLQIFNWQLGKELR